MGEYKYTNTQKLNKLIEYCIEQYQSPAKCHNASCEYGCFMHPCPHEELSNCYNCIKQIHNVNNKNKKYCPNTAYLYVLKHVFRYSSEIEYMLEYYVTNKDKVLNVASLGCGPSTELYALDYFFNEESGRYNYIGFDLDPIWKEIQDYNMSLFQGNNIEYKDDMFSYYRRTGEIPDILIVNYMLSDMLKFQSDKLEPFCNEFWAFLKGLKSGAQVFINDIPYYSDDLSTTWGFTERLKKRLDTIGCECYQRYFYVPNGYPDYGQRISTTDLKLISKNIPFETDPFRSCHSIQMVIKKN